MAMIEERRVIQLHIELEGIKPAVWRRILVAAATRLSALHEILQFTMGWTDSHEHVFVIGNINYGSAIEGEEDDVDESSITVFEAIQDFTDFTYEYDFGDSWIHNITVERVVETGQTVTSAVCIDGENACPPEDVGGPGGYERMLEALADPQHEHHATYLNWVDGEVFDRRAFNIASVNASLQALG